jgi:hypothetical protein
MSGIALWFFNPAAQAPFAPDFTPLNTPVPLLFLPLLYIPSKYSLIFPYSVF